MVSMETLRLLCLYAITVATTPAIAAQDILLEAELDPNQVYVQAQARYRLRFYHAVDVRDLVLHAPSVHVADLLPLGDVRIYESTRDGRRYRVHERSYAVLPFASGTLQLSGARATGRMPASLPSSTDKRQAMHIDAPSKTLTVLPAPVTEGHWLPAQSLTMSESWSAGETGMGWARKRTIRVEATGINASQLPELQLAAPGITVQALPARLETRISGGQLIGIREQSFLLTPMRTGAISLPAVQLPWWTPDGTPMTATLAAGALQGLAATTRTAPPAPDREVQHQPAISSLPLLWLSVAAMLGIAIIRAFRRPHHLRLMRACCDGDVHAVRSGLLAWAAEKWRHAPPRTLGALAERLQDADAREALAQLDRSLYGATGGIMDRSALRGTVLQVMRSARHRQYDLPESHRTTDRNQYINNTEWK